MILWREFLLLLLILFCLCLISLFTCMVYVIFWKMLFLLSFDYFQTCIVYFIHFCSALVLLFLFIIFGLTLFCFYLLETQGWIALLKAFFIWDSGICYCVLFLLLLNCFVCVKEVLYHNSLISNVSRHIYFPILISL